MQNRVYLFFLLILFSFIGSAQNDFGVWTKLEARVPVKDKFKTGLEWQWRLDNNASHLDQSFLSPFVAYELHKNIEVGFNYRWINKPGDRGLYGNTNLHRFTLDVEFDNLIKLVRKKSRIDASVRLRGTHRVGKGDRNDDYLRSKLKFTYNIKGIKLEPELSAELFYHFNDQLNYTYNEVSSHNRFEKYRLRLKLNYELNKRNSVYLGYMVQGKFESLGAEYIMVVGYRYDFKKLKFSGKN